jgi:hypothetical protein
MRGDFLVAAACSSAALEIAVLISAVSVMVCEIACARTRCRRGESKLIRPHVSELVHYNHRPELRGASDLAARPGT